MEVSRVFCAALAAALSVGNPVESSQVQIFSPSVRVNGMGEAGVALPDEPAGYYNPGSAALSSPAHTLRSRFYLSGMPVVEDITYSSYAAQAATERVLDRLYWKGQTRLGAALYGYRTKLDAGETELENETGAIDTYPNAEVANNFGISLALRSVVDLGIGATYRRISTDLLWMEGSARTYDLGLMSVVPVIGVVEHIIGRPFTYNFRPRFDVGLGIMWQNRGSGSITYTDHSDGDEVVHPLPTTRRHGWSSTLGMDWNTDSFSFALGRVIFSREAYSKESYFIRNVPQIREDKKKGIEISILETVSIRRGEVARLNPLDLGTDLTTSGWTVRSDGLFKIIAHFLDSASSDSGNDELRFLVRHLSVRWSRFDYTRSPLSVFPDRAHSFIGLSFLSR